VTLRSIETLELKWTLGVVKTKEFELRDDMLNFKEQARGTLLPLYLTDKLVLVAPALTRILLLG